MKIKANDKLASCPLCGGNCKLYRENPEWKVVCDKCRTVFIFSFSGLEKFYDESLAVERWNTRQKPSVKWPEKYYCHVLNHENNKFWNSLGQTCRHCYMHHERNNTIDACRAAVEAAEKEVT